MQPERFGPYLTRKQALALGAAWYVGKPCKGAAHRPYRYAGSGCIECNKANARAASSSRPRNPRALLSDDERAARRSASDERFNKSEKRRAIEERKNGRAETKARKAAWDAENRDLIAKRRRLRHEERPDLLCNRRRRRRARQRGAEGHCTADQAATLLQLQRGRCAYCGCAGALHLDHRVALSQGGTNWPENLQWLCAWHNISKGATSDADYRARMGIAALTPWDVAAGLYLMAA